MDEIVHREEDDSRALLLLVVVVVLLLLHEYDEDVMVAEDSVDNTEMVEDGGCTPMHAPMVVDMMIAKDGTKVEDAMAVVGTPMILLLLLLLLADVAYNRPMTMTTTTTVSSALHSLLLDLYHLVQERSKTMMILSDTPQLHHSQQHQHHY